MENRYKKIREDYEFTKQGHRMTMEELSYIFKSKGYSSLTYSAIRKIETGARNVSEYELKGYREVFNTTADYLLGFTGEPSRDESKITASNVTGLNGKSIKTLEILKRSEYVDTINFIMSDYALFGAFLSNVELYLNNKFDTPVHFDERLGIFVESKDVSDSPILISNNEKHVSIGRKLDYEVAGQAAFETLSVPVSILESHALHCIQQLLDGWKKEYKKGSD